MQGTFWVVLQRFYKEGLAQKLINNKLIVFVVQCQVTKGLVEVSEKCIKKTTSMGEHNFILVFIYSVVSKLALILIFTHS